MFFSGSGGTFFPFEESVEVFVDRCEYSGEHCGVIEESDQREEVGDRIEGIDEVDECSDAKHHGLPGNDPVLAVDICANKPDDRLELVGELMKR